jgi:hypothetical protein
MLSVPQTPIVLSPDEIGASSDALKLRLGPELNGMPALAGTGRSAADRIPVARRRSAG